MENTNNWTKVVYNTCHGGYGFSDAACEWLAARGLLVECVEYTDPETYERVTADWRGEDGEEPNKYVFWSPTRDEKEYGLWEYRVPRHHPLLVECVETLGAAANGSHAELRVGLIEGNRYMVREYDGLEWLETPDTLNWIVAE